MRTGCSTFNVDQPAMHTAEQIIHQLELRSHPEGGYYVQTYCSREGIAAAALPQRFGGDRFFSTAIYFLLDKNQYSAFHRIKSDEVWHFYEGSALHIYVLHPDGRGEILRLGNDIANGYSFQHVVPAGCWFASKPADHRGFSFAGCTVAPGFDFSDFEMADKVQLLKRYPAFSEWIHLLC